MSPMSASRNHWLLWLGMLIVSASLVGALLVKNYIVSWVRLQQKVTVHNNSETLSDIKINSGYLENTLTKLLLWDNGAILFPQTGLRNTVYGFDLIFEDTEQDFSTYNSKGELLMSTTNSYDDEFKRWKLTVQVSPKYKQSLLNEGRFPQDIEFSILYHINAHIIDDPLIGREKYMERLTDESPVQIQNIIDTEGHSFFYTGISESRILDIISAVSSKIIPVAVAACGGVVNCELPHTQSCVCSNKESSDCSTNGATCGSVFDPGKCSCTINCQSGTTFACNNSCGGPCSGLCAFNHCYSVPTPPPPSATCGGGPACSSPKVCCKGSCRDADECEEPPPTNPPASCGGSCLGLGYDCCPDGGCVPPGNPCNGGTGGGCDENLAQDIAFVAVRFLSKNPDGSVVAWKGPQATDPVRFRIKANNSSTFSVNNSTDLSTGNAQLTEGVPNQFQTYDQGPIKTFDWQKNRIDSAMDVQMVVRNQGSPVEAQGNCGIVSWVPHGPLQDDVWATHICTVGRSTADGSNASINSGNCRLQSKECSENSEGPCRHYCRSDVDGCVDLVDGLDAWRSMEPQDPESEGVHNARETKLVRAILQRHASDHPDISVPHDEYLTYHSKLVRYVKGKVKDIKNALVYTPPEGYGCGVPIGYSASGTSEPIAVTPKSFAFLNDEQKSQSAVAIPSEKCAIDLNSYNLGDYNYITILLEKDYYNQCYVDVNGQSDVLINTNTTSPWSTQQQISVVGISNEDRVANGGQTRLFLQKEGGQNFSPPAGFSGTDGTTGFLATNWTDPVTFITTYAYRWYENCISQNDIACTIPTGSSLVSPRIGFTTAYWNHLYNPTEHLPPGVYYAHCDMVNGDDKCSGNPLYQINGGTQPLDASWQSCAESTTGGFIEEIAIRNNVPMYRRTPVKQDTGLPEAISVQPMQGPFDHQAGIFANGDLLINSLGIYDLLDRSPMASIAHLWMTDNITGEQAMYAYTIPYSNGFPNWNLATLTPSGPYPLSSFNLVVPDNEDYELTSYTTWYNPENQKVNESIWISTASQKHYGYWRWVGLNANGTLNYATAGPWTSGTDLNLPGSGYNSFPLAGISNVMIPTPTGEYGFVQAITRRSSGQAYADFLRYQRSVSDWDGQTHSTQYMPPITAPFEQDSGLIGEQFFGVGRDEFQAYEAHYIPSNVSDFAKITVQCLPSMNCDRCSEGGEDDGCGGTCERGEIPDLGAPTITSVESSRTLVGDYPDYKDIIINWTPPEDALPGDILEYQLLVYPDSSEFADKSIDEIYAEELAGSEAIALYSVSGTTTTTRQIISNGSNPKSYPKMVVAIRAKFLCRAGDEGEYSDWGTTTKTFTSSISFEYLMLDNDDSCPPAGGEVPTNPLLSGLTLDQLATTLKASSGGGFPAGLRPGEGSEETKVPIDNSGTIGNVFSNLWVYPSSWYGLSGEGWFQLTPPDLKTVGFDVACIVPSAVSNKYRNPVPNANPADDFSNPPIIIYLKPYAQPWWQVQGGSIWADNSVIKSLIPAMCTGSCVNSLIRNISASPNPLAGSAGIPIANNSITISAGAGNGASFSDIDGNARAENVGQLAKHPFSYDQFIQDMNIFLSAHPTYSKINITDLSVPQINDELLDPAKGLDLEGNKQLFILESQGDTTLEFSATEENQIDLQGDIQVILMVDGDLTLRGTDDTLSLTNAINVPDSSYFQVISTGNITIEGELGTPPEEIDPAQPISTLEGIYVALGNLIIKGLDDPDEIDNQFVGKGSFAGLGGVTLGRSLVDALGASNLNDQNPSELFIHHPPYVLQTPEFLRQPMLTYQEQ